ncbi:8053_t:CDS:2 [Diversispora eburnea]|uniref:8053_t:CDS:1 n=1 Tax=Diversispora eburnea TaxID=1213867 RepID=A0A9N8V4H2_9GLOM|nr:8053_t:CDS:2 [Diversispora eburnea]
MAPITRMTSRRLGLQVEDATILRFGYFGKRVNSKKNWKLHPGPRGQLVCRSTVGCD